MNIFNSIRLALHKKMKNNAKYRKLYYGSKIGLSIAKTFYKIFSNSLYKVTPTAFRFFFNDCKMIVKDVIHLIKSNLPGLPFYKKVVRTAVRDILIPTLRTGWQVIKWIFKH